MSINHFSTDLPETHYWWAQQRQQQQHIMDPNPNPNYSSSSSSIPLNIPSPNFSSWPPHLYHHYHQHHPTRINNPYNPLPPQEPTSPSSSSMFPPPQNPTLSFNLNYQEDDEEQDQLSQASQQEHDQQVVDKEPMFEKPLTPSDVGKLNRLVIPKQHAEKYFPLSGDSVDKGLLLSFEDESGKHWRFRYSYWNSSQSYVLTKGWSRYVKEKQLDAGDVVLFERHRNDGDRLFIGWRRRGESSSNSNSGVMAQGSSGGMWSRGLYSSSSSTAGNNPQPYLGANMQQGGLGANVPYQPECLHAAGIIINNNSVHILTLLFSIFSLFP